MKFLPAVTAFLILACPLGFAQPAAPSRAGSTALLTSPQSVNIQSTEIKSEGMEMWSTDTETRGIFSGNVIVTGNNLTLTCDRLEITATRIGDTTATVGTLEKFKYLLASGKVGIVQGEREATCGRAEVFPRDDKIILSDKPMVVDRGVEAAYVGTELRLFRGQRRVEGDNVQITLPPIKDLGFDKNEPAPQVPEITPAPNPNSPAAGEKNSTPPAPK